MSGSEGAIQRTKEGTPIWDGNPNSYIEYAEAARLYEQAQEPHKRGTVGPKLAAELTGPAKRMIVGQAPNWLSYSGGVDRLLEHLRQELGQPRLSSRAHEEDMARASMST